MMFCCGDVIVHVLSKTRQDFEEKPMPKSVNLSDDASAISAGTMKNDEVTERHASILPMVGKKISCVRVQVQRANFGKFSTPHYCCRALHFLRSLDEVFPNSYDA